MESKRSKLSDILDQNNAEHVLSELEKIFCYHYDNKDFSHIKKCFKKVKELFEGNFSGYKACNTNYHNFTHTTDALLAVIRLVDGCNLKEKKIDLHVVKNLLIGTLFHDVGYIQEKLDSEGTGAKYTVNHVLRSINFLSKHYQAFELSFEDLEIITNIIKCTGLTVDLETIPFGSDEERLSGIILGTSDILGQMSDREYLEKLMFLYYEFKEAGIPGYNTEFDIIKNTLTFYETIKLRLDEVYNTVYHYALFHFNTRYSINENLYITAIENNINYIKKILEDADTNFRHKLKRGTFNKEMLFA